MMRAIFVLISLGLSGPAFGCDDPGKSDDLDLRFSGRAFVATVVGYRLDDTSLVTDLPDCPDGGEIKHASELCVAFWNKVVSIQFYVQIPIAGIVGGRKLEMATDNSDGCSPLPGQLWLTSGWYRDGFSRKLEDRPSQAQIDRWRASATSELGN